MKKTIFLFVTICLVVIVYFLFRTVISLNNISANREIFQDDYERAMMVAISQLESIICLLFNVLSLTTYISYKKILYSKEEAATILKAEVPYITISSFIALSGYIFFAVGAVKTTPLVFCFVMSLLAGASIGFLLFNLIGRVSIKSKSII